MGPDSSTMIFIHGGMNESGKLEDSFFLDAPEGKYTKIAANNAGPHPRANHTAIQVDDNIYIFGGNGGRFFENSVFKDLWILDVDKLMWTELKNDINPIQPESRAGHSMFFYKGGIFIYGGWNYITSFNSSMRYDIEKEEWSNTNLIDESFFVWNHCAIEVEAVPSWKYFIYGGSTGAFDETKSRERQKCHSNIYVGDLDNQKISAVVLDNSTVKPPSAEDSSMIYHKFTKSLIIFGGWNNVWFGDLYSCCVSSIVGPSYSVNSLEPSMGRISGQQRVKIYGSKLLGDNFTVYFISGKY